MATRIGINGFGRIGRQVVKIMKDTYNEEFDIVAFNDLGDLSTMAHLFMYDSNYGKYHGTVEVRKDGLVINDDFISHLSFQTLQPAIQFLGALYQLVPVDPLASVSGSSAKNGQQVALHAGRDRRVIIIALGNALVELSYVVCGGVLVDL